MDRFERASGPQWPAVVMTTTRYIERISAAATREDGIP
jgi:hypothetical protein